MRKETHMPQSNPSPPPFRSTDSAPPPSGGPGTTPARADGPDAPRPPGEQTPPSVLDTPPDFPGCNAIPMTLP